MESRRGNTRLAVEVFIDPFGLSADRAETYTREWRRSYSRFGADYVLGTSTAAARRN